MSFQELFKSKGQLNSIINHLDCPLVYLSGTMINDANDMAVKILQFNPQTDIGCCFEEYCKKNKFALAGLVGEKSTDDRQIKETYFVNQQHYTISWKKLVLSDAKNKSLLLIGKNITEEHIAAEKFEEVVHFYDNILSKLPTNVYWKDHNSVYMGCNDRLAQVMGLPSREAIKGMSDFDFNWGEGAAENFIAFDKKVMDTGKALTTEDTFREADGDVVTVLTTKTPLKDIKGETLGVLAISVDITERKKMEADLKNAKEKAELSNFIMTEFIANMGHDLVTPFSDIGGTAEVLRTCFSDKYPELKEHFETLVKQCAACEKVHKRIVDATSIRNWELTIEEFSINELLLDIIDHLRSSIGSKKLDIQLHPLHKEYSITTDREKLYAVLLELVSNAIKFTLEGEINISAHTDGDQLLIEVSDTGIGIPSDKFDYIFEQYTKLSRSNKHGAHFKGVGAGLYLVKQRAKLLYALIRVESELGKGSTFILSIPRLLKDD